MPASIRSAQRSRGSCRQLDRPCLAIDATAVANLLRALGDPVRLAILATLLRAGEPVCGCDLTSIYGLSQPTISHHLGRLRRLGLVDGRRSGLWVHYRIRRPLAPLVEAILDHVLQQPEHE